MTTKWLTVTFIQAFLQGKLGRKRVHGTYRVLDGDHCKILVRATTNYGRPSGNEVVAINLDTAKERVSFFHSHNTHCFTYRMNKVLNTHAAPHLPATVLNEADGELLASGVIDFNDNEMLIEIGDKPYLLYRKKKDDAVVLWEGISTFSELNTIPARAATISEAKELIKDPPGAVQLCGIWWVHKQPVEFQPPTLNESILKVLSGPVNPLEHGYKLEDCSIYAGWGDSESAIQTLVPHPELLADLLDSRAKSYLAARGVWNEACNIVKTRTPPEYRGLTVEKNKYAINATTYETPGVILRTSVGVFVKGVITNKEDWGNKQKLGSWYKLDSKINRIKL